MANQYILVVSDREKGFLVNAITTALENSGIEMKNVVVSDPGMNEYIEGAFGVLIADSYENVLSLSAIKNRCYELGKKVVLYGSATELLAMKRIFVDSMIYKEFERPVEMDEVVIQVNKLKHKMENISEMKKVLVVDDNGTFLRTIKGWLEGKYVISLANSASSAMTAIQKNIPDLILLDYEMPICSGAKFMEILSNSEVTSSIPVIFLTSRSDAQTVKEVMQLKPKGYILKTTPQEQLLKKLEEFFDSEN